MVWTSCWWDLIRGWINPLWVSGLSHIIPCLSAIQIIGRLFLNPYLSCFLYVCSVCLRRFIVQFKKKNSSASILNSYNFTILRSLIYCIRETFVFQTEIYIFRIFIPSLCCFFFLSSPWGSVCLFVFFSTRSTRNTRTCRCHGKWSFFGSFVFW